MTQPQPRQPRLSDTEAYLRLVDDADEPTPTPVEPPRRRPPWAWIGVGAAVLAIAALFYVASFGTTESVRADAATAQLDVTASQAEGLAAQIARACRDGAVPIPYQGACAAAQDVQATDLRTVQQTGAAGADGERGIPGRDGIDGINGVAGAPGAPGTAGAPGAAGATVPGRDGVDGVDGVDGRNGTDGRDGAPGIGIRASTQDPTDTCYRLVTYDDGRTERWGPFCEPSPTPTPPGTTAPDSTTDDPPPASDTGG